MLERVVDRVIVGVLSLGTSFLAGAIVTFFALQPQTRVEITYDKAVVDEIVKGFDIVAKEHANEDAFCSMGTFNKNAPESWIALGELIKLGWLVQFATKGDTLAINSCKLNVEETPDETPHDLGTLPL